ncbi:hypothetical protein OIDMADRAFT_126547 [Oidiodendron maius Zn]|uniref:NmrA-like domain-containing protein n=1 Tax=Oidiodendron maius (strain Zn) TaxID=913774 RepID=A0A0C3GVB4_OIDMZ|nr:hypothetical protein OIDMADRAFT_126547 [Oidiodendron maius Zn]
MTEAPIFICGATGSQGGALASILASTRPIHTISRDPRSQTSLTLKAMSPGTIKIFKGSFDDYDLLISAMRGCTDLFLNVLPAFQAGIEVAHGKNVLQAAKEVGTVKTVIYSSVAMTGKHHTFPGWENYKGLEKLYWESKAAIEKLVAEAGFENFVILRPAYLMQNFLKPRVERMLPGLIPKEKGNGVVLQTLFKPDTKLMMVDAFDVGRFAAAALQKPETFNGERIELGAEELRMDEVAQRLSKSFKGREVKVEFLATVEDAVERGYSEPVANSQIWQREVGYKVDVMALEDCYGMRMTRLAEFLTKEKAGVDNT